MSRVLSLRSIEILSLVALAASIQVGCATVTAAKIPGPVPDEKIALGMPRQEVENLIKTGPASEYPDAAGTTARYEYKDGPHQASKGRVILYIAGDFFTAFLSELIFWPIEAYASNRTNRVATAHYDHANALDHWRLARPEGEELASLGPASPADPVAPVTPTDTQVSGQ